MISQKLKEILRSYEFYYDVDSKGIKAPFDAEAVFHSHNEQYFLTRRAQLSEMDSHEFVYFKQIDNLDLYELKQLIHIAWNRGLKKVKPSSSHRNSDIVLFILANKISKEAKEYITKVKYSKNYKFSLHGWSNFQLVVEELSDNKIFLNKFANKHKDMYEKILKGGER